VAVQQQERLATAGGAHVQPHVAARDRPGIEVLQHGADSGTPGAPGKQ
jgi:hypothetical protein